MHFHHNIDYTYLHDFANKNVQKNKICDDFSFSKIYNGSMENGKCSTLIRS